MDGHEVTVEVLEDEGRAEWAVKWRLNYYGASGDDGGVKRHRIGIVQPKRDTKPHLAGVEIDAGTWITNGEGRLGVEDDCVRWRERSASEPDNVLIEGGGFLEVAYL